MTTQLIRSCFAAVTAVVFAAGLHAAAVVGQPAPDFKLTDIKGTTHNLADFKGKTVVLEWVNPECPFVVKHYEKSDNIPSLQKTATADGVIWLSINSAAAGKQGDFDAAKVAAWSAKTKAAPTAYLRDTDGSVGKLYGAKTTPHIFVINPEGVVVYNGAIDSIKSADAEDITKAENYAAAALAAVKAGHAVAKPTTQPYGCSVKY
ncbi:redoxin domain-containing protein [Rariglobus hedericola]|uniref:Redoxin domain-containing protein n=1 Tax=Rariglobus hedericola TaxID=2597822 RepID=A0A556QPD5_9BACT|nr:redoxin domain-containing protein [Rariglobus hedericola]TSJ78501.1 redoxin domain-containing protein [Rariglobus hedericola]